MPTIVLLLLLATPPPAAPASVEVRCLKFSPDGRWLAAVTGSPDTAGELIVWDAVSREVRWRHREPVGIPAIAFSPDGATIAIGTFSPEIRLLDAATGEVKRSLTGHTHHARCLAFTPDGANLVSGSYDRSIKIWDLADGSVVATLTGHSDAVYSVAVSPDGSRLISVAQKEAAVRIWDLKEHAQLGTVLDLGSLVPQAALSPDGTTIAASSWTEGVCLIDVESKAVRRRIRDGGGVSWTEFSPDGRWLAWISTGPYGSVMSCDWNPDATQQEQVANLIAQFDDDDYQVREAASRSLAGLGFLAERQLSEARSSSSPETRVRARKLLEQMSAGENAVQLSGHRADLRCAAFSPDSALLATADALGAIKLWRTGDWTEAATLRCGE